MNLRRILQKFDFFSSNFEFTIENEMKKKTSFGGILSCIIIVTLVMYLIYLMYLYNTNQFMPKIISNNMSELQAIQFQLTEDFLFFEVMINGRPLDLYQKEVGKKYINYHVLLQQYHENGEITSDLLPLKVGDDKYNFIGMKCIDTDKFHKDILIINDPILLIQQSLFLQVQRCHDEAECASVDEIDDLILNPLNYFQTYMKIQQYNSTSQQLEVTFKSQYFFFDIDLVEQTTFTVKKAVTQIYSGLVIQQLQQIDHLIGYTTSDRQFTARKLIYRRGLIGYAEYFVELSQEIQLSLIVNTSYTDILPQFLSVVSSLFLLGLIAQFLAEQDILTDVAITILINYYSYTAIEINKEEDHKKIKTPSPSQINDYGKEKIQSQAENIKQSNEDIQSDEFLNRIGKTNTVVHQSAKKKIVPVQQLNVIFNQKPLIQNKQQTILYKKKKK